MTSGRETPQRIKVLVPDVLRQVKREHGALFGIQRSWSKLVGKELAARAKPISLRRRKLTIQVSGPGEGFALRYQQGRLLDRLKAVAGDRVEEIVIRPGEV